MTAQILEIHNLIKRYDSTEALKGIDLSVTKGSIFGIIGMSGAGKSTLIRCLTCLEVPSEGKIILHGKKMGMIFQHFNLFLSRNALDNVAYPLEIEGISRSERHFRAKELLHLVNLESKEHHYPTQLSGGEKQRIAIARALANKPDLLLCDEATSALDPHTTQSILQLLTRLNEELNLTILLITHEMEVIKQICTHVAVLEQGEIVEQGEVADLFAAPKHPTTRRFLQNLSHEAPCCAMKGGKLVRLSFKGESAEEPIISELMRTYHVEINILAGGIDHLRKEAVGNLVVEITGSVESQEKACAFLQKKGVICNELE